MAEELAALKGLQAGLNATFEAIFAATTPKKRALAKEQLIGLGFATATTAMGPAFAIIQLSATPIQFMAVRIALDLNIFETIAQNPATLTELATQTKADRVLLKRILRMVSATGYLQQLEVERWGPTPLTQMLAVPAFRDWTMVHFDGRMDIYAQFPAWLRKHNHQTSWTDGDNIVDQTFGKDLWEHYADNPDLSKKFDSAMSLQENFPPEMTPPYPFPRDISEIKTGEDEVTLVDVGGGFGQAIKAIKKTYPDLKGRFILQDLPKTIEQLQTADDTNFEPLIHNFFEEQPVKNAKYYHLRRILHDWSDGKALEILKQLRPALKPGYSKLLVTDFVLPDIGAPPAEASVDLMMMTSCNGKERTESEWHELLATAGFEIEEIWRPEMGTTSVIEASLA